MFRIAALLGPLSQVLRQSRGRRFNRHLLVRTRLLRLTIFRRRQVNRLWPRRSRRGPPVQNLYVAIGLARLGTVETGAIGSAPVCQRALLRIGRVGMTTGTGNAGVGRYGHRRFHRAGGKHERTSRGRADRSDQTDGNRCLNLAKVFLLYPAPGELPVPCMAVPTRRTVTSSPLEEPYILLRPSV